MNEKPFLIYCAKDLVEGIHWRRLTKEERLKNNNYAWKAVLIRDVFYVTKCPVQTTYSLISRGKEWGKILPDGILIRKGYAWDLCSVSPDLEIPASLPHDIIFQFSCALAYFAHRITVAWATQVFKQFASSLLKPVYVFFLKYGSWMYWRKDCEGMVEIIDGKYVL